MRLTRSVGVLLAKEVVNSLIRLYLIVGVLFIDNVYSVVQWTFTNGDFAAVGGRYGLVSLKRNTLHITI